MEEERAEFLRRQEEFRRMKEEQEQFERERAEFEREQQAQKRELEQRAQQREQELQRKLREEARKKELAKKVDADKFDRQLDRVRRRRASGKWIFLLNVRVSVFFVQIESDLKSMSHRTTLFMVNKKGFFQKKTSSANVENGLTIRKSSKKSKTTSKESFAKPVLHEHTLTPLPTPLFHLHQIPSLLIT